MTPILENKWLRIENATVIELINLDGCVSISPEKYFPDEYDSKTFLYSIYFLYAGQAHNEIKFNSKKLRDKAFNAILNLTQPHTIGGLEI